MTRKVRGVDKKIIMFVEGDTEENYFSIFKQQQNKGLKIMIEKVKNINGGGYSSFLKQLKKNEPEYGYLAIFIILDLDKIGIEGEKENFDELVKYCKRRNKESNIQYFIMGTNFDFEYFLCKHSPEYKNGEIKRFVKEKFNYTSIDNLKADKRIYIVVNKNGCSYKVACESLVGKKAYIRNNYVMSEKGIDIKLKNKKIEINEDLLIIKNSNMDEFFDIVLK